MNALAGWLKENNVKRGDFAERIGVSASYITNLCADPPAYWPGRDVAERIRAATNGAVTPNDFLPPAEQEAGSGAAAAPVSEAAE